MKKDTREFSKTVLNTLVSFSVATGIFFITRPTDGPSVSVSSSNLRTPQAIEQEGSPRQSPEMNKFKNEVLKKNWPEVQAQLMKSSIAEKLLTVLAQEKLSHEDEDSVFELTHSLLETDRVSPRIRVLSVKIISAFNLNQKQQKKIRKTFTLASLKPFTEDLLPQAFLSTVPFPKDLTERLRKDFSSSPGRSKEVLFLTAGLKDRSQKRVLEKSFLQSFSKASNSLKPFVAKSLILTIEPDLKTDERYKAMLIFAKKQNDEIWSDIKGLIQ
jgi:hypothetical protein